jgi:hypothetical protein
MKAKQEVANTLIAANSGAQHYSDKLRHTTHFSNSFERLQLGSALYGVRGCHG